MFLLCFNSLQTGKHIQSDYTDWGRAGSQKFQFPSNGKAYPKKPMTPKCFSNIGFNSLQTGKHIQREERKFQPGNTGKVFQFPSNGKAYPKGVDFGRAEAQGLSFNSLQTGKHIQREL